MHPSHRDRIVARALVPALLVVVAASLSAACSGRARDNDPALDAAASPTVASTAASGGGTSAPACLSTADVTGALGFGVRDLTKGARRWGDVWTCGFEATDPALPGVTVTAWISPGSEADKRFAEMRETVQTARGASAEPDAVPLGEKGMVYQTSSRSMATAVKGGRLYSVEAHYGAVDNFGDKKSGMVALLKKLMGA